MTKNTPSISTRSLTSNPARVNHRERPSSVVFCLQDPRTGKVEYTRPGQRPSWAR